VTLTSSRTQQGTNSAPCTGRHVSEAVTEDGLFSVDISLTALPTDMTKELELTCTPPRLAIEIDGECLAGSMSFLRSPPLGGRV
jgi:hypothetical protein